MKSVMHYSRRVASFATATALLALGACSEGSSVNVDPVLPSTPAIPAQYRGAAFIMDVSTLKKSVKITAPTAGIANRTNNAAQLNLNAGEPQLSLLGGDVVDLTATNFVAGAVGASVPGKVLITFDLTVNNKLAGLNLITPTFPTPPSGATGVQAFPFEISVTTTSGGVGTNGNEIIVTSPRFGAVVASNDWDGSPHNFFNDVGCLATSNDCFRFEPFATVGPLGASAAQTVGFLVDPTVGDFRVKLILAADLQSTVTPNPTTVSGTVSSNIGPLNNVSVSVSGGFSGSTDASGAYSIANVASGANKTISVSNLPAGCTLAPASVVVTLPAGGTFTQNFTATCAVPTGTITGTVSSVQGANLSGVSVVVTPTGGAALASVSTNASGVYTRTTVPTVPADGNITIGNLPAGCVNAGPYAYSGVTTGSLTVNIVVDCPPAPVTYPFSATWGSITNTGPTGRQVTLTLAIDMGAAPGRADIDGANADPLAGISFNVGYNGALISYASRTLLPPGGEFDLGAVNQTQGGTASAKTNVAISSTSGSTLTGNIQLIRLTYNIATGASGTINPVITITEALATTSLVNVTSSVAIVAPPSLNIP